MFKERKSSFRRNMAFLVFVAFIFAFFPDAGHAATNPSSKTFLSLKKPIPFISAILYFVSLNLSTSAYNLALFSAMSSNTPEVTFEINTDKSRDKGSTIAKKQKNLAKSLGNSTSQRPPTSQDDD
jgi:hypothetical protein